MGYDEPGREHPAAFACSFLQSAIHVIGNVLLVTRAQLTASSASSASTTKHTSTSTLRNQCWLQQLWRRELGSIRRVRTSDVTTNAHSILCSIWLALIGHSNGKHTLRHTTDAFSLQSIHKFSGIEIPRAAFYYYIESGQQHHTTLQHSEAIIYLILFFTICHFSV